MVHAAFTQAAAITAQTGQQVMQFEDLDGIDDDADPPPAVPPLPTDASTMDHIRHAAACVWRTPCLRPAQERAVHKLIYEPISGGKLLVIDRTGGGKSLILQLSAVIVAGIAFVLVPLISLTANNISKIKKAVQSYGSVHVHHMDETSSDVLEKEVIPRMETMDPNSSTKL